MQKHPLHLDALAIVAGEAVEHAAERAGLLADVDDLAKQRRKELARAGQARPRGCRRGSRRR